MPTEAVRQDNLRVLTALSRFLNGDACLPETAALAQECTLPQDEAFALLLAAACGCYPSDSAADLALYRRYYRPMVQRLSANEFREDPYRRAICFPRASVGRFTFCEECYAAYEAFVRDDFAVTDDGRMLPQIGFFAEPFAYPAVKEDGRIWMTATPNEIATMREPIAEARGHVLTYGLGLGYFAWMVSEKPQVERVTVVDQSADVLALFEKHLLPQFANRSKVRLVQCDAFAFAQKKALSLQPDFVFTDLWHDVSDGLSMLHRMKSFEPLLPNAVHRYWIEKSLRCYEGGLLAE